MIKFFRHIRQRMLKENKMSKYLLYAIGEIILVVIGILIAIAINTRYQEQGLEESNETYLQKLEEELKLNIVRMNFLAFEEIDPTTDPSLEMSVHHCDSLLKLTARGLQESDVHFILNGRFWSGGSQLNLHDDTYQELLNSGRLYSLGSDELLVAIKEYYKKYERNIEYNRTTSVFIFDGLTTAKYSLWKMNLDFDLDSTSFSLSNYPWFFDRNSQVYQDLQLGMMAAKNGQNHHFKKCVMLIEDSENLIEIIEKELAENYSND